jgi:DNA-binding response OmpR family regulator
MATEGGEGQPMAPVLVVEDDPDTREILATALAEAGLAVATAADGREALRWLDYHRPAVVLLDLRLPDARGEDIAGAARARYGPALPVLVVTGAGRAHERAEAAGSVVYLAKPFDLATLVGIVTALLAPAAPEAGGFPPAPPAVPGP